jgi:HK97 gp10 family phage protein
MIKLVNRSGKFMRQLKSNELSMLNQMGYFLMSKMDYHVAVDTGYLLSRNTYVINRNELFLMNDCEYAIHQEYGTYKMKAHPFMRPSALNYTNELKRIAANYLGKGM